MDTLAAQLAALVEKVATEPWPTTRQEHGAWAKRVGLPEVGEQVDDGGQGGTLAFSALGDGGRVVWDLTPQGRLVHVSWITSTLDDAKFAALRTTAEQLRDLLDHGSEPLDADVKGPSWRSEWCVGNAEVELYWDDATRNQPAVDATLHLAFHSLELHVEAVDERDSSWERHKPIYRVYVHDSAADATCGDTATFDVTGGDVGQVIDWAQRHTRGNQTYAIALVVDDQAKEELNPGHGRGLVWLLGTDGNDSDPSPTTVDAQRRMLARRGNPIVLPDTERTV